MACNCNNTDGTCSGECGCTDITLPVGKQGKPGTDGLDGTDGDDGVSVTNAEVNSSDDLIITLSNGQTINAGNVGSGTALKKYKEDVAVPSGVDGFTHTITKTQLENCGLLQEAPCGHVNTRIDDCIIEVWSFSNPNGASLRQPQDRYQTFINSSGDLVLNLSASAEGGIVSNYRIVIIG